MKPLLGPLLGHVTHDTAIAWVRLPGEAPLDLVEAASRPLTGPRAGDPGADSVARLPPIALGEGTACGRVPLLGGAGELHAVDVRTRAEGRRPQAPLGELVVRAAPAPSSDGRIAFAFGSCWRVDAIADSGAAWRTLLALARARHVEHLLLLGDQMYADETPLLTSLSGRTATRRIERLGIDAPLAQRASGFRESYQRAWEPDAVQRVLQALPSASIWDDHEIVNGFGSLPWHREPKGLAIFEAAALANDEFQDSRNPGRLEPSSRAHAFRRGPAAFLTLDLRTHRDHARGILLGDAQERAVDAWLRSDEALSARVLFVACSVPPLHLSRTLAFVRGRSDINDQWSSGGNERARARLLRRLHEYEEGSRRRVVVLGGDAHLASVIRARRSDGSLRWHLTSSPLANRLPSYAWLALTLLGRRFRVRVEGEPQEKLEAHVVGRWKGPNVGVVTGEVRGEELDLTCELFRPGKRTLAFRLADR